MIESITVINPKNESLVLTLTRPEDSGLYVKNIDGLGTSKANINTIQLASADGSIFSSSRVQERNIVLTLGMLFSPTIEDARLRTYKFFPIKKQITLIFKTSNRTAEITGIVESNEPDIFAEEETTQISILCPDPNFYEVGAEETIFSGVRPMFEFPFSNESLTEDLIEFGDIRLDTRVIFDYKGDTDTGVRITLRAMDIVENVTIYNSDTYEELKILTEKVETITGVPFGDKDELIISTINGSRGAILLRDGLYTNVISVVDRSSDWLQLTSGDNSFEFTAEKGQNALSVTFFYRNAYGGI